MEFDWDPPKRDKVLAERGIDFANAVAIFSGHVCVTQDVRRDYGEVRMTAIGCVGDRYYTVVYTDRGLVRWVITAWSSNRKERAAWQRSR